MKIINILLLVFLLISISSHAQNDFRAGYVIDLSHDTICGKIDYRRDLAMSKICILKNANGNTKELKPTDIKAYRFIDGKYYISKVIDNKPVFLEFLIKGEVNIYYLRSEKDDRYFIEKKDAELIELPFEEGIKKNKEGKPIKFRTNQHIGLLNHYMRDADNFTDRINAVRKPGHINLINLAQDYHEQICEDYECIIYERLRPIIKVNLEGLLGLANYKILEPTSNSIFPQFGAFAYIRSPRINERIFLSTGLLYARVENSEGRKISDFDYHLQIGYEWPNLSKLRPHVAIGLFSPSYTAGIRLVVHKNIYLGIQAKANFDFEYLPVIPTKIINYGILSSIYIDF